MQSPKADFDPYLPKTPQDRIDQMNEVRGRCPVAFVDRNGGSYEIMTYEDIVRVARDTTSFINGGNPRHGRPLPPLETDPPEHRLYRAILQPFFATNRIKALEAPVRRMAVDLLKPMLAAGGGDFARGLSYPLPVLTLCLQLGIANADWDEIKRWSEGTLLMDSEIAAERAAAVKDHERILTYAHHLIAKRRADGLRPEDDIVSALIAAEPSGSPMDDAFIADILRLFISAGHNSTTSGLGNAILHLAENIDHQNHLRAHPDQISDAIEEILRLNTPVQEMPRWAAKESEIAGRQIPAGSRVGLFWASGNRDPAAFPQPDVCLLDRKPNRHLAFGSGIHMCLGAPLARLEIRAALEELLARTTRFEVAGEVVRAPYRRFGVNALPLKAIS